MNTVKSQDALETKIGLYWLHRLGIASLVFGFAFLMMYSVQYFGPVVKVLLSLSVSTILIVFGETFARKKNAKWFGYGIAAGGWSLVFFTTYAAYYVPSVKLISSLPLVCCLLLAVAGGSLFTALRANSQLMAVYSVVLASCSILTTSPEQLGEVAFLIIGLLTCILGNRRRWNVLFASGLVSCYLGHFVCTYGLSFSESDPSVMTATIFASLIWLIFTVAIGYSIRNASQPSSLVVTLICANALLYSIALSIANAQTPHTTELLLVAAGGAYFGIAKWLRARNDQDLSQVHWLAGLTLINGAKAMRFSGVDLIVLDTMQIALLAIIGLRYDIKAFRWVSVALTCALPLLLNTYISYHVSEIAFGMHAFNIVKAGLVASALLAALTHIYRQNEVPIELRREAISMYGNIYCIFSNVVAAICISQILSPSWLALAWTMLAIANHIIGVRLKDQLHYGMGILILAVGGVMAVSSRPDWIMAPIVLAVTAMYATHAYVRSQDGQGLPEHIVSLKWIYGYGATALLTVLIGDKAPDAYLSMAYGLEALCLLAVGFVLKDKSFRMSGLVVIGILVCKLLFVDMVRYNTLERIVSFIGAGLVLLISSFAYGKFTKAFEDADETVDNADESEHAATQSIVPEIVANEFAPAPNATTKDKAESAVIEFTRLDAAC